MRIIEITDEAIRQFCQSWPCSNLHDVAHVIFCEDESGNLVDLDAEDSAKNILPPEDYDGPAIVALLADASKGATKQRKSPNLISNDMWTYDTNRFK